MFEVKFCEYSSEFYLLSFKFPVHMDLINSLRIKFFQYIKFFRDLIYDLLISELIHINITIAVYVGPH